MFILFLLASSAGEVITHICSLPSLILVYYAVIAVWSASNEKVSTSFVLPYYLVDSNVTFPEGGLMHNPQDFEGMATAFGNFALRSSDFIGRDVNTYGQSDISAAKPALEEGGSL